MKYTNKNIVKYGKSFEQPYIKVISDWVLNIKEHYKKQSSAIIANLLFDLKVLNSSMREYVEKKFKFTTKEMHIQRIDKIINKYK